MISVISKSEFCFQKIKPTSPVINFALNAFMRVLFDILGVVSGGSVRKVCVVRASNKCSAPGG